MVVDERFVASRTTDIILRDATRIRIRPVVPEDKPRLLQGFERLSPESRYRRFLGGITELTPEVLRYLTEIDYRDHFAWGALAIDEEGEPGVGVSRYIRLKDDPSIAEAAVAVVDDYHGRGLGTILLEALAAVALENGIRCFRSYVLSDNEAMLDILKSLGATRKVDEPGIIRADLDLPERIGKLENSPMYAMFRAAAKGEIPVRGPAPDV